MLSSGTKGSPGIPVNHPKQRAGHRGKLLFNVAAIRQLADGGHIDFQTKVKKNGKRPSRRKASFPIPNPFKYIFGF
jgi:hypothetical protein